MSTASGTGTAAGTTATGTTAGTIPTAPTSTTTSALEHLPSNVPTLELSGANWPTFSQRFRKAMIATQRWGYLDGSVTRPVPVDPANPTPDEEEKGRKWDVVDQSAQFLLQQRLLDSTALTIDQHPTAALQWRELTQYFTKKSAYAKNDLETTFREMRCTKNGDVRVFLASVRTKREELRIAGVTVTDAEYERTVLKGIPPELASFASSLLSSARFSNASAPIDIERLIDSICEEADRLKASRVSSSNNHQKSGGKSNAAADDALAATGSEGKKKRRKGKCHNCGKMGHWARECRSPKKDKPAEDSAKAAEKSEKSDKSDKAQKSETKPVGSANAVVTQEDCPDGCSSVDVVDSIAPDSDEEDELIDESDWLCEVDEMAAAVITPLSDDHSERVEMYDSGATRHLSPYRSDFTTYAHLDAPIYFNAANQQKFAAVGIGSLAIHTPNGLSTSTLTLHDVLHSPSVGCTLVSLGALDKRGYRASLGGGHLELFAPGGERVCRIPRNSRGLYRVVHSGDAANSAELISVMELHRRMGHIAPASARALVEKGLVTGIKLDPNSREGGTGDREQGLWPTGCRRT